MTRNNTIIKLEDLRKEFIMAGNPLQVLKGISIDIAEGEFVTIMGASGSGKSTMLNILGCLDQASSGIYELDGEIIRNMNKNELAEMINNRNKLYSKALFKVDCDNLTKIKIVNNILNIYDDQETIC